MKNTQKNLLPDAKETLEFLGLSNLPDEQKSQVIEGLVNHLQEMVLQTFTENLPESHAQELEKILAENPAKAAERIQDLASRIPGLTDKIEIAIKNELEVLKSGYDHVNSIS